MILGSVHVGYVSCLFLSAICGHSVHFANFQCQDCQRLLLPQFSANFKTKLYGKYGNHRGIQAITLWQCAKLKQIGQFDIFMNRGPYGAGNFKTLPLQHFYEQRAIWGWKFQNATPTTFFIRSQPNIMRISATIIKYRLPFYFTRRSAKFQKVCGTLKF